MTASCISAAESARTRRTPAGGSAVVEPATTVTSAPRARAASASAKPILPEERFEMKRTGSISSRVAPVVMRTRSPARSCARRLRDSSSTPSAAATMTPGSLRRPGPNVPQAISPSSGWTTRTPSARSRARLRRVAGWFHIVVFIAGATTTGALHARYVVERKSSATPLANLAMMLAVAGATRKRSTVCEKVMCAMGSGLSGA